jgi:hypothetical protein
MENQPPNNNSKPMKQNLLGEWVEVIDTEPLTSYTQVLQQQEAEPHYNDLMERLEKSKVEQSKKL